MGDLTAVDSNAIAQAKIAWTLHIERASGAVAQLNVDAIAGRLPHPPTI
jgi:hypothetical protein